MAHRGTSRPPSAAGAADSPAGYLGNEEAASGQVQHPAFLAAEALDLDPVLLDRDDGEAGLVGRIHHAAEVHEMLLADGGVIAGMVVAVEPGQAMRMRLD